MSSGPVFQAMILAGGAEIIAGAIFALTPTKGPSNPVVKDELITEAILTGVYLGAMGAWNVWDAFQPNPSNGYTAAGLCFYGYCTP